MLAFDRDGGEHDGEDDDERDDPEEQLEPGREGREELTAHR